MRHSLFFTRLTVAAAVLSACALTQTAQAGLLGGGIGGNLGGSLNGGVGGAFAGGNALRAAPGKLNETVAPARQAASAAAGSGPAVPSPSANPGLSAAGEGRAAGGGAHPVQAQGAADVASGH